MQQFKQLFHSETYIFRIREMASEEIRNLLPRAISDTVFPKVDNKLEKFVINDLPNLINKRLDNQLPDYDQNSSQHQQLVNLRFYEIDKKNDVFLRTLERKVNEKLSDINQLQVKINKLQEQNTMLKIMIAFSFLSSMIIICYIVD